MVLAGASLSGVILLYDDFADLRKGSLVTPSRFLNAPAAEDFGANLRSPDLAPSVPVFLSPPSLSPVGLPEYDFLRGEEKGFLSPVESPPKLLFGLSSDEPALPEYDLLRGAEYFFSPLSSPPKLLFGRSLLLSAELTLPEYGLLRPGDFLSSPPSLGLPEYGLRGAYAFFSPPLKLLLKSPPSLLPAPGLLPAVLLLSPGLSDVLSFLGGLFQSVLSEPDDLPFEAGLFGLSSDLLALFDDLPGALSRPVAGFLNAIIFCLALSQREGQSYDFLNNIFNFLLVIRICV